MSRPLAAIVACTLGKAGLATQIEDWQALWAVAGIERVRTADGIRLLFRDEPAVESELNRLVRVEDECCSWAAWQVSREEGALSMYARSSGAGTMALHGMFDVAEAR